MSMIRSLLGNLLAPVRTQAAAALPPAPAHYRGALTHEAALCTACGTCAYVCAPKAIRFVEHAGRTVSWTFYMGQCSFCGLCQQNCPTGAIGIRAALPVTSLAAQGDGLRLDSRIAQVRCSGCGQLHIPLPAALQAELLADCLGGVSDAERDCCPECRRRASSERLRRAFQAPPAAAPGSGTRGAQP